MFSFKFVILCALVAITVAEPPRRKLRFRSFARQEEADNDQSKESGPYPPAGLKPEGQRLVLPARQRDQSGDGEFTGYSYPKPTDTYGPPEPETTESAEPTTTEASTDEPTTDETTDEPTTDNPQAENVRLSAEKLRQLVKSQKEKLQSFQHLQPFFYVINPNQLSQPQIVYILQK